MRQTEINNEIVLLKQPVHQARICVISKLIRDAKKLRTHRGNDKQLEKNKNKSDKLLREVFALKHVKDDEVSKFGIMNFENLQDLLKNTHTDDRTRAMIKVIHYKCLHERIVEFMEKFPDYREYICWKKKRNASKRKGSNSTDDFLEENQKRFRKDTTAIKVSTQNGTKIRTRSMSDLQCHSHREQQQKRKISKESTKLLEHLAEKKVERDECKSVTKVISKEAAVKRFAEVLQEIDKKKDSNEHEENNNDQLSNDVGECKKRTDDFFLSSDEPGSSVTVLFAERKKDHGPEVDHRAFKALCIRSKEEKFSQDSKWKKGNSREHKINGGDVLYDLSSTRKRSITYSKEKKDMQMKNKPVDRNIQKTTKKEDEKLHPSWVAKRKQQEIVKQGFLGKKIKFDED